jgi:FMN phosphatase YigB (HAD superfamily)
MAICQRGNIPPEKVLYIGDSFQKDTLGARDAGMCSAYLRREGTESAKEDVDLRGHLVIDSLYPSEIEAKLKNFFS